MTEIERQRMHANATDACQMHCQADRGCRGEDLVESSISSIDSIATFEHLICYGYS